MKKIHFVIFLLLAKVLFGLNLAKAENVIPGNDSIMVVGATKPKEDLAWMKKRIIQNSNTIDAVKKYLSTKPDPFGYGPCKLNVSPGLVRENEKITISLKYKGIVPANSVLTVERGYLNNNGTPETLTLSWVEKEGVSNASVVLTGDIPGNWRIIWRVNGKKLSRIIGVITKNYAVCTLWSGNNNPILDNEVHQFDLPADQWMRDWWSPFDKSPEQMISDLQDYAGFQQKYGQRIAPFVNADWILPGIANKNLMDVPTEIQQKGLEQMCDLWNLLGLGPVEILGSYTLGSQTPGIAEKLGISAINSLCQWQNWRDGNDNNAWRINHWGAPIAPYFIAKDDFRKAGANIKNKNIVAFGMGTASSVRNYCILTMEGCPSLTCPNQRYNKVSAQAPNIHRFYVAVQGWINDAKYQDEIFFTTGLEHFSDNPDWQKANALAVEYLVKCTKNQNLVFASAADVAKYFQRYYHQQPEHFYFQPDIYSGYRCDAKPVVVADRIETSNHLFHSLHAYPAILPQFYWDFTTSWNTVAWDEKPGIRNRNGLIVPEVVTPDNCIPVIRDFRGINALRTYTKTADGVQIQLTITSDKAYTNVPLALWDIPLVPNSVKILGSKTKKIINTPKGIIIKPIVNSFNNILHGIATISRINAGSNVITCTISGTYCDVVSDIKDFGCGISGRVFHTDEKDYAYFWRQDNKAEGNYILNYSGDSLLVLLNDGTQVQRIGNKFTIPFDKTWQHETPVLIGKAIDLDDITINR